MGLQTRTMVAIGVMLTLTATPGNGHADQPTPLEKTLTALEKQTWKALQTRDRSAVNRLWADDFAGVLASGVRRTKADVLKTLPDLTVTSYSLDHVRAIPLHRDVALLTYRLTRKSTFQGKELPARCYASSAWVNHGGHWAIAFYQETPISE